MSKNQRVNLQILDVRGRIVQEILSDEPLFTGRHKLKLKGESLYSGVFFVVLETEVGRQIAKVVKLR